MAKFIYVYHGGAAPRSPEEGQKVMKQWTDWFGKLGAAMVDGGNPLGLSKTVGTSGVLDGGGANPASGYSLVTAKDMAHATEMAKGCPMVLDGSGTVEVAECHEM